MKTLNDFKDQVAQKRGYKDWGDLDDKNGWSVPLQCLVEAAELYATHREEEGRKEGWKKGAEAQQLIDIKIQEMGWEYKGSSSAEYQPVIK